MSYCRTTPTNIVTVEPALEPVDFEDVKNNAYVVDDPTDNAFIRTQLIPQARRYVEQLADRSLITQTRKQIYDYMPAAPIDLRYSPVQSVSSFTYLDSDQVTTALATTYYSVDTYRIPGSIHVAYSQSWPSSLNTVNAVQITYVAGYGSTQVSVPIIYRRAIILLCTHWYINRDAFGCGDVDDLTLSKLADILSIEGRTVHYA